VKEKKMITKQCVVSTELHRSIMGSSLAKKVNIFFMTVIMAAGFTTLSFAVPAVSEEKCDDSYQGGRLMFVKLNMQTGQISCDYQQGPPDYSSSRSYNNTSQYEMSGPNWVINNDVSICMVPETARSGHCLFKKR
jgi:hypothetical protein